jgi:hypothetical protein
MIDIDGILVDKELLTKYFLCDIEQCLGACCTFYGIYGAPLNEDEVPILEKHIEITKHILSDKSKQWIAEHGTSENTSGRPTTICINNKDCVFVYYKKDNETKKENNIALCTIEDCYFKGKTNFRKPISCWLFPIRVGLHKDIIYLYYEKIKECNSAVKNGKQKNIKIYQALKEPLIAFLGEKWYNNLEKSITKLDI